MAILTQSLLDTMKQQHYEPSGKGFKTICTDCGGNNFWFTPSNGLGYCWNCGVSYILEGSSGRSGPQMEEKPSEQIDDMRLFYEQMTSVYQRSLTHEHLSFLEQRGISRDSIERFRIGYCPAESLAQYRDPMSLESGVAYKDRQTSIVEPVLGGRIVFPYIVDGRVVDMRGRTLSDDPRKYLSVYKSVPYRDAHYAFNHVALRSKRYIITEGEIKAIIAAQFGFSCLALPGMLSWRKYITPNSDDSVTIMFDRMADVSKSVQTDRAIAKAAAHFLPEQVRVASLPLLGEDKMDIDSFLLHKDGGPEHFQYVIDGALPLDRYKALRRF